MADISYYWKNKEGRAKLADIHTKDMWAKFPNEIANSSALTVIYDDKSAFNKKDKVKNLEVIIDSIDSVTGIMQYAEGKTAVLNFASFKSPGGGFLSGSRAQEESLCHESFLYNVLSQHKDYYDFNLNYKNNGLYINRALYSPAITFERNGKTKVCDVITCAAPNITPSRKYGWGITKAENSKALESRIKFVLDIAETNNVDILILGAFGCGVFGQDATEVCQLFLKHLKTYHCFKKVVFAVPEDMHTLNYYKFETVLKDEAI